MHDIALAYKFHNSMEKHNGFTKSEFQRTVKNVTKCQLTEGQVDVLFELFDEDNNGRMDGKEFEKVMKVCLYSQYACQNGRSFELVLDSNKTQKMIRAEPNAG